MVNYRFYSRKTGYEGGGPIRYFMTCIIIDNDNETKNFVDLSGKDIINLIENIRNNELKQNLKELANIYNNWYYYPDKQLITDGKSYL